VKRAAAPRFFPTTGSARRGRVGRRRAAGARLPDKTLLSLLVGTTASLLVVPGPAKDPVGPDDALASGLAGDG